jgi:hypothetical protein
MPLEKLNLERVERANTSDDVANIITQAESWFNAKKDSLNDLQQYLKSAEVIDINGTKIEDPKIIKGMKIGVIVCISQLGDFPIKLAQASSNPDDEDE